MKLDVKIERLVDLMTQVGIGAAERQNHADFDGLGLGGSAHCESQGGNASHPMIAHRHPPYILELVWNPTNPWAGFYAAHSA